MRTPFSSIPSARRIRITSPGFAAAVSSTTISHVPAMLTPRSMSATPGEVSTMDAGARGDSRRIGGSSITSRAGNDALSGIRSVEVAPSATGAESHDESSNPESCHPGVSRRPSIAVPRNKLSYTMGPWANFHFDPSSSSLHWEKEDASSPNSAVTSTRRLLAPMVW